MIENDTPNFLFKPGDVLTTSSPGRNKRQYITGYHHDMYVSYTDTSTTSHPRYKDAVEKYYVLAEESIVDRILTKYDYERYTKLPV